MSFMSGFAESFGQQISQGQQQRAAAKSDAFKIAYDSYINKKSQYDSDKKQDQQYIDMAKALTAQTPGVPPEAWDNAYQLLKGGMDATTVQKRIAATTWAATATPSMAENMGTIANDTGTGPNAGNLNSEMVRSGMSPMNPAAPPSQQDPNLLGSLTGEGGLFNPKAAQQRQIGQAQQSVQTQAGVTPDQFNQTNAGYQPLVPPHSYDAQSIDPVAAGLETATANKGTAKDPNNAYYARINGVSTSVWPNGDGTYQDLNGKKVTNASFDGGADPMTKDQNNSFETLAGQIGSQNAAVLQGRGTAISLAGQLKLLDDTVQQNQSVLTKAGNASTLVNEAKNEVNSVISQVKDWTNVDNVQADAAAAIVGSLDKNGAQMTADAKQRFASQLVNTAFTYARYLNGTGSLATADVEAAFKAILGTNDQNIFSSSTKQIAKDVLDKSKNDINTMLQESPVAGALQAYPASAAIIQNMSQDPYDQLEKANPGAKAWVSSLQPVGSGKTPPDANGAEQKVQNNGDTVETAKEFPLSSDQAKQLGLPQGTMGKLVGNQFYIKGKDY